MNQLKRIIFSIITLFFLQPLIVSGQLSAPGAVGSDVTSYPVFSETDSIYIFCTTGELEHAGVLLATTALTGTKTFTLEKYDIQLADFDLIRSESIDDFSTDFLGLEDGCYRVTITQGETAEIYRAWVFNNWYTADGEVTETNCDWFKMEGTYSSTDLKYYDLADNTELLVNKNLQMQWKNGDQIISSLQNLQIYDPPTQNTNYTFSVFDKFGCEANITVPYESIVTKAVFTADPMSGEAPLEVTFTNQSENGDEFEWFFYYDLDYLKQNLGGSTNPDDSIMRYAVNQDPIFIYENSGTYMVKLVSKKINQSLNLVCVDTAYMEDYITVDTSFIAIPNVFTPNGDGTNDLFIVKFWSMQNIKISIFNRWGQRIHYWQSNNIQGFEDTWTATVWDGRLMAGRMASPGVYNYVVEGVGRDGKKRQKNGFFHLFRGKD